MANSSLGAQLQALFEHTRGELFNIAELAILTGEALTLTVKTLENATTAPVIPIQVPVGVNPDGSIMPSLREYPKDDLIERYGVLFNSNLPLTSLYHLVTICETWLGDLVRRIVLSYPKKLGHKRTVQLGTILACDTLEGIRIAATNSFIHELFYKSPREYADEISPLIGVDILEIPAFWRYVEIKATRDAAVHNRCIANEVYLKKATSHARAQAGQLLPVNTAYFMQSYETCLQLVEAVHKELGKQWPPPPKPASDNASPTLPPPSPKDESALVPPATPSANGMALPPPAPKDKTPLVPQAAPSANGMTIPAVSN